MTTTLGYLVYREGRHLFIRDLTEVLWAVEDPEYKVTRLVAYDDSLEVLLREVQDDRNLYAQICEMLDEENRELKAKIKELERKPND